MRFTKLVLIALGGLWALLVLLASNGPAEVEARAREWAQSPLLSVIPLRVMEFASSPPVIAVTCLGVGLWAGWKLKARSGRTATIPWWRSLANEMQGLADEISQTRWSDNLEQVNARVMTVALKARKKGLEFPSQAQGYKSLDDLLPYLHRVGALLREGEVATATQLAKGISEQPPVVR